MPVNIQTKSASEYFKLFAPEIGRDSPGSSECPVPVVAAINSSFHNRHYAMSDTDTLLSGVIKPQELYTLKAFKRRLEIADATLRSARRAGLRVTYIHKQGFILGRDWIDYVMKAGLGQNTGAPLE